MATKVYKYGLLPPTSGETLIAHQCDLAWRSAVARLRAYEAYRAEREAITNAEAPACAEQVALRESLAAYRKELRALRTGRSKPTGDAADMLRAQIAQTVTTLRALTPVAKAQREALKESGRFTALLATLKSTYLELAHRFAEAGLFWGQRQLLEASHDQRIKTVGPLKMPTEWGAVGVQIQGGIALGTDTTAVSDSRITITADTMPVPGRGGRQRPRLRLRIGPDNGIAEWPIIMHRPLPAGSSIRFVKVTSQRIGRQVRWDAHLTVNVPDADPVMVGGVVAVRPTFSAAADVLIAAETCDDAGQVSAYAVHPGILGGIEKARGLQKTRDKERDILLKALETWRASGAVVPTWWPAQIARWESCDRLRQFVTATWARQRFAGDDMMFAVAWAWARQDSHLWDWERHASARALRRRLNDYRVWAAMLAEQYGTLVIPKANYAAMAQRQATPEQERELSKTASSQRVLAAPGLLRTCLVQGFEGRGKRVIEVLSLGSPAEMLSALAGGAEKVTVKRAARFAKRHKANTSEACATAV